ncbi:zinc metalloprotease HtpX [Geobacter sp. DSM 9736]|uniref:zinc metalloprotease HtpX n=1 Tax=Geobacter sp. DSM 9736 TaxID=1277350 RepID=UPI000B508378|nr:zinc metalloprotease HtpX [Geobacter sp. DSM 9736]SNB46031.1 heat shock protein HtpX [Geobacter sp. DSM 9736]
MSGFMSHRLTNLFHTIILLGALLLLLALLGWSIAGVYGIIWAILVGILPLLASLRIFPALTLKMFNARPLDECEAPKLHAILREICRRARLPAPRLHYIASDAALVFSIGHGATAAISVSDGILRLLTLRELTSVLAHEVSHILHKDTWVMSFADVVSRLTHTISIFGQILILINLPLLLLGKYSLPWLPLLLMLTAPLVSALLQLALSRTREYNADMNAVELLGDGAGLASALAKMEEYQRKIQQHGFAGHGKGDPSLLRTHPPTEERIRRLHQLTAELDLLHPHINHTEEYENLPTNLQRPRRKPRRHFTGLWH